ncbi:MAG: hypothetical protein ACI94Y_003708 [Maribacter sp.]|jgi:hypothetical protein
MLVLFPSKKHYPFWLNLLNTFQLSFKETKSDSFRTNKKNYHSGEILGMRNK